MWQVLADGLATGLADDLEAWEQYERASHGRKQVTFSRGLRRRYRLAEEESDDEIADRDAGGDDVIALPAETWRAIRDRAEQLLTAAETDGVVGAALWLSAQGLSWSFARSGVTRAPCDLRRLSPDAADIEQAGDWRVSTAPTNRTGQCQSETSVAIDP